ncbi:hypothetical protein Q8A67_011537 [Cirrhinus molitorella]|uniref:Uncharacterized protein n=1 Tax=Cirrhinus molitorella TaxID=172907 RepID=A0AA88PS31_9TELE|nr:hypothetical protein Q8A67_011537 [Cirrhinus molitorella]
METHVEKDCRKLINESSRPRDLHCRYTLQTEGGLQLRSCGSRLVPEFCGGRWPDARAHWESVQGRRSDATLLRSGEKLQSPLGLELKNLSLSRGHRCSTSNGFMTSAPANALTRAGGDTGREEREVSD